MMGVDVLIALISLVVTKGPTFVIELQKLFGGNAFDEDDLKKLADGVKDPASYFKV